MRTKFLSGAAKAGLLAATAWVMMPAAAAAQPYDETPGQALSRNLRILANDPDNFDALIEAGNASVEIGDLATAAGFFGRAEEERSGHPEPQAGMGRMMVAMGDPVPALRYFDEAARRGGRPETFAADRGLAHDLLGDTDKAQADYRLALGRADDAKARRRLALSLAITGDRTAAMAFLTPLLQQGDPAARRAQAFVLALTGDLDGARRAIDSAMPGAADQIGPFLQKLPRIDKRQKAAAVHLGLFPGEGEIKLAEAAPPPVAQRQEAAPPPRQQARQPSRQQAEPAGKSRRDKSAKKPAVGKRVDVVRTPIGQAEATSASGQAAPREVDVGFRLPSTSTPIEPPRGNVESVSLPPARSQETYAPPPAPTPSETTGTRLASIDKLLKSGSPSNETALGTAPPASTPKYEVPPAPTPKYEARPKVEAKAPPPAPRKPDIGVEGTTWIQLAGGSRADGMPREWRRLQGKAGNLLDGQSGHVTQGVDYFRLVIGPFSSKDTAQSLVNKLRGNGIDSFVWTRSPAQLKIEKL
ncbi:SPOR domain-containing protein [Sphingomicrobium nitratireducens]|uniref:SPOR domain-containing protein n=1 Tax=Sphingomicrobium nitratireducens TaxID=2964666 RepID=UPI00223F43B3|nr:SPOR domain-containing protein [Sphingomicrobium nitratireducens]